MASLTGQTIQSTYDALLKISGNDALTSSLQRITDGLGNFSPLYLSTTAVEISSGLNVVGSITGSNLSGTNTGDETNSTIKSKLGAATSSNDGYLTSTDWSTFNAKQNALGYTPVPNTRSLTINGTAYDLSADRSWSVGTVTSVGLSVPTGFAVSNSPVTGSGTLGLSFAAGYSLPTNLSQASWDTAFSSRIATFTTTGNSGAATFASNTLNIPNYTLSGLGGVPTTRTLTINGTSYDLSADRSWTISTGLSGSGTTNYVPKFTGSTSLGNSLIFDNGTNVGIGTSSPGSLLHVGGSSGAVSTPTAIEMDGTYRTGAAAFNALKFYLFKGASESYGIGLGDLADVQYWAGSSSTGTHRFFTSQTERMRITSGGNVGIGTTTLTGYNLALGKTITGAGTSIAVYQTGQVQSDVTASAFGFRNDLNTQAATFTLPVYTHYQAQQGTVGAGTTLTTQIGFSAGTLTTGSNVFGFRGQVASGTGRWNLYMDGTAANYLAGNLGIGTTSPTGELHIFGSNPALRLQGATTGNMQFGQWDGTNNRIQGSGRDFLLINTDATNMLFSTNNTERMRITSGGNVGIGTSSPARTLDINGTIAWGASSGRYMYAGGTSHIFAYSDSNLNLLYSGGSGGFGINNAADSARIFQVTDAGNVGIGTTSPNFALGGRTVLDVNGGSQSLFCLSNAGTYSAYLWATASNVELSTNTQPLNFVTNGSERMRITSGGNVGIGTTSPDKRLHISGSDTVLRIQSGTGGVYMQMDSGASSSYIGQLGTSMYFENGGTERMRITSAGNVGVNTTSPSYKLDVNGDIRSTGAIRVNTGTIDTALTFDTSAGAVGTVTNHNLNFWINGTTQAKLTTDAQLYVGTGIVSSSAKVQIDSTTKGFLPPRMTSLQRIAIASPAVGLMVYQTDNAGGLGGNEGLYIYKSGGWTFII